MARSLRIAVCILLAWALPASAGYYVTLTVKGSALTFPGAIGTSTGCFLTPSMAISALMGTAAYYSVDVLDSSGNWSFYYTPGGSSSAAYRATGTYSMCTANPAVATIPNFVGSVTDPAISGNGVLAGGSGGSSGSGSSSVDTQALTAAVSTLATQVGNTPKAADIQALSTSVNAMQQQVAAIENDQFNYTQAAALFAFFCGMPLLLWFVAKNIGVVLETLRSI